MDDKKKQFLRGGISKRNIARDRSLLYSSQESK